MHDLSAIQSFLARVVRERDSLVNHGDIAAIAPSVATGNSRLSPVEQIDIYREQFWLRHIAVLEEDFVSIVALLGEEGFDAFARDYLTECPPTSFTLRDLGDRLAHFVAQSPKYQSDKLLLDLAKLEWCFVEAFDSPDAPPLDPTSLAQAGEDDWPRAVVVFHPSVQRVALAHPAHEYRTVARRAKTEGGEAPARCEARDVHLVVYRGPENLQYIEIEPDAHALLDALAAGTPLGPACEIVARASADAGSLEQRVGAWFQQWTSFGWVSEVRFNDADGS